MKITYRVLAPGRSKETCKRKVRYGRQTTAEKARDHMAAKTGKQFDAYNCGYCGGWHIGTAIKNPFTDLDEQRCIEAAIKELLGHNSS